MDEKTKEVTSNPQVEYRWQAPLRAYKKRSAGVLRFYIALSLLLSLIVFFFGDKILVLPIAAVMFLFYVLTTTPPPIVTNKITKFGIEAAGNLYRFSTLSHFYFTKRFDYHVLVVVSHAPYYYHLYMVVPDLNTKERLINVLSDHLMYQEHPHKSATDRLASWLVRLMPEENEATSASSVETSVVQPEVL